MNDTSTVYDFTVVCGECGCEYEAKDRFILRKTIKGVKTEHFVSECTTCGARNETPLVIKEIQRTTWRPSAPRPTKKNQWGSPRVDRQNWSSVPYDIKQALEEEERLRRIKNGEEETVQREAEEGSTED